jgi:hypothetical protein
MSFFHKAAISCPLRVGRPLSVLASAAVAGQGLNVRTKDSKSTAIMEWEIRLCIMLSARFHRVCLNESIRVVGSYN